MVDNCQWLLSDGAVKTPEKRSQFQPNNAGFTRADLLALLVVLAVLAMLTMPTLGRVSQKSAITQCAANLQQFDLALQLYGSDNQDNLPTFQDTGVWPWDTAAALVTALTNNGLRWTSFYCPGTASRFTEQDDLALFNYEPNNLSVIGYAMTLANTPGISSYPYSTNSNLTLTTERVATPTLGVFLPARPGHAARS